MPKIMCECDHIINLSTLPRPRGVTIFPDEVRDDMIGEISLLLGREPSPSAAEAKARVLEFLGYGNPRARFAVQCENCQRLLVLNDHDDIVMSFILEPAAVVSRTGRGSGGLFN